uniref:Uncharacterized protein n=1 Tax=Monodon monoceros TaxID=40151 RepID=A0A8C6BNW6_MONMO
MLFPSFFAGPCMPAHSPGRAGRSTRPEARSYSSMCFRTAKGQQGWFKSGSGAKKKIDMMWRRRKAAGYTKDVTRQHIKTPMTGKIKISIRKKSRN